MFASVQSNANLCILFAGFFQVRVVFTQARVVFAAFI